MKLKTRKFEKKGAFTIIELLTVMSIIVILFGLLMPAMTLVRTYSKTVKQQAQFHAIESGLQLYHDDFEGYPPSDTMDRDKDGNPVKDNKDYPGAMKLAEALLGEDLLGFNPNSIFRVDATNPNMNDPTLPSQGKDLYPFVNTPASSPPTDPEFANMRLRKGPYVDVSRISAVPITSLYIGQITSTYPMKVICDEFPRISVAGAGKRVGLPVLYFKANISSMIDPNTNASVPTPTPQDTTYIYNYTDNYMILSLLKAAWDGATENPIADTQFPGVKGFYDQIQNSKISNPPRPYNQDTYILMSAGPDGLYGTRDDVFNFTKE